jgi:hypothetical protein
VYNSFAHCQLDMCSPQSADGKYAGSDEEANCSYICSGDGVLK